MSLESGLRIIAEKKVDFQNNISKIKARNKDIKKKLLISGALGGTLVGANWVGAGAFALNESALIYRHLPEGLDRGLILGLTYGVHAAASVANLIQEGRLLKNPKTEMSQNFPATLAYHGLGKVEVLKEKRGKRSVAAVLAWVIGSLSWNIPRESAFISLALLSPDKMQELTVLKSAQALFAFSQVGAAEIVLRTIGRQQEKEESKEESVRRPVWKTVFRRQQVAPVVAQKEGV